MFPWLICLQWAILPMFHDSLVSIVWYCRRFHHPIVSSGWYWHRFHDSLVSSGWYWQRFHDPLDFSGWHCQRFRASLLSIGWYCQCFHDPLVSSVWSCQHFHYSLVSSGWYWQRFHDSLVSSGWYCQRFYDSLVSSMWYCLSFHDLLVSSELALSHFPWLCNLPWVCITLEIISMFAWRVNLQLFIMSFCVIWYDLNSRMTMFASIRIVAILSKNICLSMIWVPNRAKMSMFLLCINVSSIRFDLTSILMCAKHSYP